MALRSQAPAGRGPARRYRQISLPLGARDEPGAVPDAGAGRLRCPVDARRQSDQVAPRPHQLVLRAVHPDRTAEPDYEVFDEQFEYLFNSYYYTKGQMHPRGPSAGCCPGRPCDEIVAYREHVDEALLSLVARTKQTPRTSGAGRAGAAARAAAPGADAHGHQTRVFDQSVAPGTAASGFLRAGSHRFRISATSR